MGLFFTILKVNWQYKKLYLLNVFFFWLSFLIQLVVFDIFVKDSWNELIRYLIIANFLAMFTSLYKVPEFSNLIAKGEIYRYGVRPMSYVFQIFIYELGDFIFYFFINLPLLMLSVWLLNLSVYSLLLPVLLSVVLSIEIITFFYSFTSVFIKNSAIKALLQGVSSFLSGSVIPLFLWPKEFQAIVSLLPFAAVIDVTIKAVTGKMPLLNATLIQLFWIVIFSIANYFTIEIIMSRQKNIGG